MSKDIELTGLTHAELFSLYPAILAELKRRGLIRREDNPVGDYAEFLVARALGGTLVDKNSHPGFDLIGPDGISTVQVKSRRLTAGNQSRELGDMGQLDQGCFDHLAGVLFNSDFSVLRACLIPFRVVNQLAARRPRKTIVFLRDSVWDVPGVRDITSDLRKVANAS